MKRVLLLMLVMCYMMVSSASAISDTTVTIPLEFQLVKSALDQDKMIVQMLGSSEQKLFNYSAMVAGTTYTFSPTYYYAFNKSQMCGSEDQFRNITLSMGNLLATCGNVVNKVDEQAELKAAKDVCEATLTGAKEDLTRESEANTECKQELQTSEAKVNALQTSNNRLQEDSNNLGTCKTDLKTSNDQKLLFGIGGIVLGYLIWGRKKGGGPSEQAERGSYADQPRMEYQMPE